MGLCPMQPKENESMLPAFGGKDPSCQALRLCQPGALMPFLISVRSHKSLRLETPLYPHFSDESQGWQIQRTPQNPVPCRDRVWTETWCSCIPPSPCCPKWTPSRGSPDIQVPQHTFPIPSPICSLPSSDLMLSPVTGFKAGSVGHRDAMLGSVFGDHAKGSTARCSDLQL